MAKRTDIDYQDIIDQMEGQTDDGSRLLTSAARELRDKALSTVVYRDDAGGAPDDLTLSIIGNVDGGIFHQGFTVGHDDEARDAFVKAIPHLPKRGAPLPDATMNELARSKIQTFAVLVVGRSKKGVIIRAGWHPDITEGQAMSFIRLALGQAFGEAYFAAHDVRHAN